jgi:hypothetical protein
MAGRPEFLEPYRTALEDERDAVATLRELSSGAGQEPILAAVDAVELAAQRWRGEYAEPVVGGVAVAPEQGMALFNRIRGELRTLVD